MNLTIHVYLHGSDDQLSRIERGINHLLKQGMTMTQLIDDVVTEVANLKTAFAPLPAAVDALEAAITDLKSKLPDPTDADKLTQALADLKTITAGVGAAVADAGDGTDEAVVVPPAP